jgi:hypothetical protein
LKVGLDQGGDYIVGYVTGSAIPNEMKYGHFEALITGSSGVAWIHPNDGAVQFHLASATLGSGEELVLKISY